MAEQRLDQVDTHSHPRHRKDTDNRPFLHESKADREYDRFRNPDDTPGVAAVAVVTPLGASMASEETMKMVLDELRLMRLGLSMLLEIDLRELSDE